MHKLLIILGSIATVCQARPGQGWNPGNQGINPANQGWNQQGIGPGANAGADTWRQSVPGGANGAYPGASPGASGADAWRQSVPGGANGAGYPGQGFGQAPGQGFGQAPGQGFGQAPGQGFGPQAPAQGFGGTVPGQDPGADAWKQHVPGGANAGYPGAPGFA